MPPKRVLTAEQGKGASTSRRWRDNMCQMNPEYGKNETKRAAVCVILNVFILLISIKNKTNHHHSNHDN